MQHEDQPALPLAAVESPRAAIARLFSKLGPVVGLAAIWILLATLKPNEFLAWGNQRLMLLQTVVVGTAAVGATLVIISGGIDLSVGSAIALGTVVVASLLRDGWSPEIAALGGIAVGMACGLAIGAMVIGRVGSVIAPTCGACVCAWVWVAAGPWAASAIGLATAAVLWWMTDRWLPRTPLPPFIVTLGMWGAIRGIAKGLAQNQPVYPAGGPDWLRQLMEPAPSGLGALLPPGVWVLLGLALLASVTLRYTRFGRHVVAIGSNEATARLCGVAVERRKLAVYVLAGACAGIAACLQFSFLTIGDPTTADGYELKVIASVVIGGASLAGGEGGVFGTLVGALIMTVVDNGCTKLGMENWVQEIVTGAIIVAAVLVDRVRQRTAA